jgi:ssDNA-binding Zn-finger/Zn-ribbon topoisomerase 1
MKYEMIRCDVCGKTAPASRVGDEWDFLVELKYPGNNIWCHTHAVPYVCPECREAMAERLINALDDTLRNYGYGMVPVAN